jgi:hypothetical protein
MEYHELNDKLWDIFFAGENHGCEAMQDHDDNKMKIQSDKAIALINEIMERVETT